MKRFFAGNTMTGILGFVVFATMGLGLLGYMAVSTWYSFDSIGWPVTEGRVLSSKVVTHTGGGNTRNSNYVPRIDYEYTVGDRRYTGDRLAFGFGNRSPQAAKAAVRRFRPDRRVRVFYDAGNPERSVLMPGFRGNLWLGWLAGFLFLAAAFLTRWYDAWFQRRVVRKRTQGGG
jgi:hypothetical protein